MLTVTRPFLFAPLLLLATFALALAWPETAPDRATISGPGLKAEVEITDSATLDVLRLGTIENFDAGTIPVPKVGEGYRITRYFYGGKFNFGLLQYYPALDAPPYVYFEDGPDLEGDHTAYHRKWFYAKVEADDKMKRYLTSKGVSLSTMNSTDLRVEPENESSKNLFAAMPSLTAPVAVIALVLGLSGWLLWRRVSAH